MRMVRVNLKERSYDIVIAKNSISKLGSFIKKLDLGDSALIVTNQFVKNKFGSTLERELKRIYLPFKFFIAPDSEKAKSFKELIKLLNSTASYGREKRLFLIAFGGGVIGDLTGFCASIYKRGIPYIQIPTTLLAQTDSSIGGKTAIDLDFAKNLVGSFYQPRLVISDLNFLKTLNLKEIKAGLSEIVKYAIIKDKALFNFIERNYAQILGLKLNYLKYIVTCASKIKAKIVSNDERDTKDLRIILNFGHTIGHAIEVSCEYKFSHGQAIALGMIYETRVGYLLGVTSKETKDKIERLIKELKIAPKIGRLNTEKVMIAQGYDKKFIGRKNRFILVQSIGRVKAYKDIPASIIKQSLN